MNGQKKVLILNASHNDERMIKALKELDFYVISTGNASNLPGHKMCDQYIEADYSKKEHILQIVKELGVDKICACCNDEGVKTAAYVSEKLGISGYDSYETTLLLHEKDRFKRFCVENNIDTPKAKPFDKSGDAKQYIKEVSFPIIVKAVDLSAGNGIRKAESIWEAYEAIDNAFLHSRNKHIVIEEFIDGSQHGFCTFLINKKVVAYCSNNEYSFINPYRVEIDTFPADDEVYVEETLISQIEKIADILNLCDGIFHLQYITDKDRKPHIIECMRRIPGGLYTIPAECVSGINWDYWEVRAKCTNTVNDFPVLKHSNRGFFSYKCLMAKENGVIESIIVSEELNKHKYYEWRLLDINDEVRNYLSTPIGYIFTSFESEEEMKKIIIEKYDDTFVKMKV